MNNSVLGKSMENVQKYRNTELVKNEKRRDYLVSKLNYHTTKWFSKNLIAKEMNKSFNE